VTKDLPYFCNACKQVKPTAPDSDKGVALWCAECAAKCRWCGGTGKTWIHPRLGLWVPCVCAKYEVKESSKGGKGVFIKVPATKNEIIWNWSGQKIYTKAQLPDPYPDDDRFVQVGSDKYVGEISGPKEIDDYLNHSCEPNCHIVSLDPGFIYLLASRDIQIGEEITFDYSVTMKDDSWEMTCNCGTSSCRKVIREKK
jgi:SET domain-containing protein